MAGIQAPAVAEAGTPEPEGEAAGRLELVLRSAAHRRPHRQDGMPEAAKSWKSDLGVRTGIHCGSIWTGAGGTAGTILAGCVAMIVGGSGASTGGAGGAWISVGGGA